MTGNCYGGKSEVKRVIDELSAKTNTTQREALLSAMQLVYEYMERGLRFLPVDLYKSDAKAFLPEDGKIACRFHALMVLAKQLHKYRTCKGRERR